MKATSEYRLVMYACFARLRTARMICWAAMAGEETNSRLATAGKGRSVFNIAVSTAPSQATPVDSLAGLVVAPTRRRLRAIDASGVAE